MPHDLLNPIMALLVTGGLFGALALVIPFIAFLWTRQSEVRRDKLKDVLAFLFGKPVDPVDTLALGIFCLVAISFALSAVGAELPAILMVNILILAIPAFMYSRAATQRARELDLALPMALQQVANEMAAGATLETALKRVANTAPAPADIET